ncbi:MAG: tetratricopeptide repeat protein [Pseudomonadota bacterium]
MPEEPPSDGLSAEALRAGFRLGEWTVSPLDGHLQREDEINRVQPKAMDVLVVLASAGGKVVEREDLLREVWGERAVSDEPLTRCIGDLRRALGDRRDSPVHISTIPKRGYRLLVPVSLADAGVQPLAAVGKAPGPPGPFRSAAWPLVTLGLVAVLAIAAGILTVVLRNPGENELSGGIHSNDATPAIAILPFLNLSADPADAFMADGTAETLTHVLSRVDGLKVMARSSAFAFREAEDVRVIGDALDVEVVLEGSVQVLDGAMRITTQLVATSDGRSLWSAAYDQPVEDLFAVQDRIAGEVAAALQVTLLQAERGAPASPAEFEAYREYLLGTQRLQERTAESILAAERHFSTARELDERYALAHVGYAEAISLQHYYLNRPIDEIKALALPAIDRAMALDSRLGEAQATLGSILFNDGDTAGAEAALQRAVALSPNYARAWFGYGTIYNDTGRPAEALKMHLRALELNPLAPHINNAVAVAYEKLGEFTEAAAQFERTTEIAPDYGAVLYRLASLQWNVSGDAAAAITRFEQAFAADPANPWAPALLARLYLDLGDAAQADRWIVKAEALGMSAAAGEVRAMMMTLNGEPPEERLAIAEAYLAQVTQFGFTDRFLRIARDAHLESGDFAATLDLYRDVHPELFAVPLDVSWVNFSAALDLAYLLKLTGAPIEASALLDAVDRYIVTIPRLGCCGYGIADVESAAIRGDVDAAIAALKLAIAEGWKADWWWETRYNPNLQILADSSDYAGALNALTLQWEERRIITPD